LTGQTSIDAGNLDLSRIPASQIDVITRRSAFADWPDIFRAAQLVIEQHGDDAPIRAARRADELLDEGGLDGVAVWQRILEAIEELTRGRRQDEPLN